MAREREGAAREDQGVEVVAHARLPTGAHKLHLEEAHVPGGRVGHENRAVEQRLHVGHDVVERARSREHRARDAVDVFVADAGLLGELRLREGADQRLETGLHLAAHHAFEAQLDDAMARDVEAVHFEVDEEQWRFCERHVPGRARRRRGRSVFAPVGQSRSRSIAMP